MPKISRGLRLLHIASNHIDIMCDKCKTAFDIRLKGNSVDIFCPNCNSCKAEE